MSTDTPPTTSEYEQERRNKLQKLRDLGVDPYGSATPGLQSLATIKALSKPEFGQDGGPTVKAAGRVVLSRSFGKLTFVTLRDDSGDLQIGLDKKRLSEHDWAVLQLVDLGDQITVEGPLGTTKKGEITIWASTLTFSSKSLLPPPGKWDGLADIEQRYRQRYVDLWSNPEVMRTMQLRIRIVDEVRQYLRDRGFIEVETPMLQTVQGGAAARPFKTHHNALDIPLVLRIAPELYLKRLLVGGFSKVFEINRNFRNEGISPRHNPEFTMLEAYEAYGNFETMADLVEGMICHIAEKVLGTLKIEHKNAAGEVTKTINLQRPWRRVRLVDLVEERTGWKFDQRKLQVVELDIAAALLDDKVEALGETIWHHEQGSPTDWIKKQLTATQKTQFRLMFEHNFERLSAAEQLVEVYEKFIEPTLIDPTFVTHVPSVIIPLARENKADPFFADVYELAINGQEISPGYTELNDPDVQAKHFAHQVGDKDEQQKVDEDFLTALRYGMPPAGGIGLGIDRLVMMLTGVESIRDIVLFPLMKPQG
jgi:lysyl-tRNA synthetase class 2